MIHEPERLKARSALRSLTAPWSARFGFAKLREILKNNKEIFEIKEWTELGRQIIVEYFEPKYDGNGEGFWFQPDMRWIIYCSYENSITFGGAVLIQSIKDGWKDWDKYIWGE